MTPYWTALFACIAGVFTLAFKWHDSFKRLYKVGMAVVMGGMLLNLGAIVGVVYGRSGDRSLDGIQNYGTWTLIIMFWAMIIAEWLAPKGK